MEKEKPREPPQAGDIRLDPFEILRSEQPLSGEEKALLRRGYDLFEFYRRHLLEEHGEMRRARALRQKKQVDRSRTTDVRPARPTRRTLLAAYSRSWARSQP